MKIITGFVLVGIILLNVGCSYAAPLNKTNEEIEELAGALLNNVLEGLKAGDYEKYSRNFDRALKEAITEAEFENVKDTISRQVGNYLYREYLGFLEKEGMTVVLFKGVFDKSRNDVLIKLAISEREEGCFVTGVWFQ